LDEVSSEQDTSDEQLRRLEALIDPALVHLDTGELLDELLDRVRDLLHAETVAVLLVDPSGSELVARAARGLEDEVYQGIRVPLGRGFAGRIAATRAPAMLDRVAPDTVVNPILWQKGVTSLLGVPLIADGKLLGVMHVGSMRPRQFDDHDTTFLQLAASRIATALRHQQTAAERSAARTLQQGLLPTRLPAVPGLEFATRFVPAEDFGVGGDWFDAFRLPDGAVGVVIGDVAGTGLGAAIVMGRLRSTLRAYAIESTSPAETLDRVDRKFAHFEPDELATILYLVVAPDLSHFTVACRGHPPPVVAEPGRRATVLDCSPSPPIGAHVGTRAVDTRHELRPGSTVACYTDGLIERHGEAIDQGLERLRSAFAAGVPDDVCRSVMAELIGSRAVEDDTALLVFRRAA
jgi:putative methionine-R-sulfoxide reductase with GAF domain